MCSAISVMCEDDCLEPEPIRHMLSGIVTVEEIKYLSDVCSFSFAIQKPMR